MVTVLLAAALSASPTTPACPTPQPGPSWVCQDGGWLPPGHPAIPPPPAPAPAPEPPKGAQPVLVPEFQVGKTYRRPATQVVIHIVSLGVAKNGVAVYAAECLNQVNAEQCWYPGAGRLILANATAVGWEEVP